MVNIVVSLPCAAYLFEALIAFCSIVAGLELGATPPEKTHSDQPKQLRSFSYNAIKDPQWYTVQGSDTTMLTIAASLPGQ